MSGGEPLLLDRDKVVEWLLARASAHDAAAVLPRQVLPDRLRREGSAGTCRMLANELQTAHALALAHV